MQWLCTESEWIARCSIFSFTEALSDNCLEHWSSLVYFVSGMAPASQRQLSDCYLSYSNVTIDQRNTTAGNHDQRDTHAVLYIVCTLLFYSLGIIVGIVTYLKKEKEEIEENRMFDEFMSFRKGTPLANDRHIKVQEVVKRLEQLENLKLSKQNQKNGQCYLDISVVGFDSRANSFRTNNYSNNKIL